jgi:hypothetical protein
VVVSVWISHSGALVGVAHSGGISQRVNPRADGSAPLKKAQDRECKFLLHYEEAC